MIVFVNGNEIRFIDENRALRVAKQNNTVVFGLNRNLTHNGFLDAQAETVEIVAENGKLIVRKIAI